jgi:FG-GAP repeat
MPQPDSEDDNPLGLRIWSIHPQVVIRFRSGCDAAEYRSTARTSLNRVPAFRGGGPGAAIVPLGRIKRGRVLLEWAQLDAYAGQIVRLLVRVTCGAHAAEAARTFQLPAASCDDGFLHVYELHGRGEWTDERGNGRTHPLRAGDLVGSEDGLRIAPGGRAVVGAAECNGFRVDLGPGEYGVGGYRSNARGEPFAGARGVVTADAHAGGWNAGALEVLPLGTRCGSCATAIPSTFEARGARVRVLAGEVLARVAGRSVRVHAGEEAGAVCATANRCRLAGPRVFQPDEPWSVPLQAALPQLHAVLRARVTSPPPQDELAPAYSRVAVYRLPAAGGAPEQLAVRWSREFRPRPGSGTEPQEGMLIWQRVAPTRWRIVYRRRSAEYASMSLSVGDVNGDGHPDVLTVEEQGSGACGRRVLVAWAAGRERILLVRSECESAFRLGRGALVIDEPVGPCPYRQGSVHCFGGIRHVVTRWSGALAVQRTATVKCALPRLDPTRGCVPRRS